MRDRLWSLMGDLEDIIDKISVAKEASNECLNYLKFADCIGKMMHTVEQQTNLLHEVEDDCWTLHNKLDETMLDVIHGRL